MRTYILKSLLPWLVFFAFADGSPTGLLFGASGGIICLLLFDFYQLKKFFVLDWTSLIFMLAMLVVHAFWQQSILVYYSLLLATIVLTLVSFITLALKCPWTSSHAKIQAPRAYWQHPIFLRVNIWLTAVWGLVFLFYTLLIIFYNLGIGDKLWMLQILPTAGLIFGMAFMLLFPDVYRERLTQKNSVAGISGISGVRTVKFGNVELGYRLVGEGPLLVLAHGAQTNMHSWDPDLLRSLSEKFQLLIFDYPGMGYSSYKNMPFTAKTIANCLYGLLHELALTPRAIVGYSMGGYIAQYYALLHPKNLQALVLIGTTCGGKESVWCGDAVVAKLKRGSAKEISGEECLQAVLEVMFSEDLVMRMRAKFNAIFVAAVAEGVISQEMLQHELELMNTWREDNWLPDALSKLEVPTLIITGLQDVVMPPENAKLLERIIPHTKLIEYDTAGHGVIYQYPLDVANNIKDFVEV